QAPKFVVKVSCVSGPTNMLPDVLTEASREGIPILFIDPDLVVVNKPSGLLVHRGLANDRDVALFRVRDALGAHVFPLHRLDRGTSGALVFARTRAAASTLGRAFQESRVDKRYLALVRGTPPADGVVDYPLPKNEGGERVPAVTHFRLLARSQVERCSLVEARPLTGRLHQVRRHLCHLGHPLVGDVNHGRGEINRHFRATYALHRLALHAHFVGFEHPLHAGRVSVQAPLPLDLGRTLHALGLEAALAGALADCERA
ncbi:MAG TPA: pseudouridine synthase, partial [Polyangiaceae bacterium]|nr:pseudouridine synthase [Polyangiaceae bacterium]